VKYLGRGIHNKKLLKSLTDGHLSKMLEVVIDDSELDVQIRNNYLNIYYNGGNIAMVKGENAVEFDKYYFYLDMKTIPTRDIKKDLNKIEDLNKLRNQLLDKFKEHKYEQYFDTAKRVMDSWQAKNRKPEREDQHKLSLNNQYGLSDYAIIDLEYEVSSKSDFVCSHMPNGKIKAKKPRFDIIAVNKQGKLCIIELKKGIGALKNTSGLKEHWECYKHSIGKNTKAFKEEMQLLLKQKRDLELVDNKVIINESEPEFMFAYAYDNDSKLSYEEQDAFFQREYDKIGEKIHCIKIKNKDYKLLDF